MFVKSKKILGIDYGDFTIGLAIFDLENDFIYPYKTIFREKANILRKSIREIVDIVVKENIDGIVIGLPLNLDGTSGDRVSKVKVFEHMLENKLMANEKTKNMKIDFQDERLTTKEASGILSERGIKKSKQKKVIDQLAAEIILQDFKQREGR